MFSFTKVYCCAFLKKPKIYFWKDELQNSPAEVDTLLLSAVLTVFFRFGYIYLFIFCSNGVSLHEEESHEIDSVHFKGLHFAGNQRCGWSLRWAACRLFLAFPSFFPTASSLRLTVQFMAAAYTSVTTSFSSFDTCMSATKHFETFSHLQMDEQFGLFSLKGKVCADFPNIILFLSWFSQTSFAIFS